MNRGSRIRLETQGSAENRFNEAPIHESGKSRPDRARALGPRTASMRPRFMNRGSVVGVGPVGSRRTSLQ